MFNGFEEGFMTSQNNYKQLLNHQKVHVGCGRSGNGASVEVHEQDKRFDFVFFEGKRTPKEQCCNGTKPKLDRHIGCSGAFICLPLNTVLIHNNVKHYRLR